MTTKKIDSLSLQNWVEKLISKQKVVGVKAKGDRFVFDALKNASELRLDYDITILPPKKYFLPPQEAFVKFESSSDYEPILNIEPLILFGVHTYDLAAINQMDVFYTSGQKDPHYIARRERATIVALDPERPSKNTFSSSMGTATVQDGFDILLTKINGFYLVESKTEKGNTLLKDLSPAMDANKADLKMRTEVWENNKKGFNRHVLKCSPTDLPKILSKAYDHPVWAEMSKKCYSCGSCNLVCPTCYCFDVQDDLHWDLKSGERCRLWDGCLLKEFAIVAGNHNFRKNVKDRFRHRFLRKGKFLWDRLKQISCVGCGRCVTACTTNIANPVEVYNKILES